MFYSAVVQVQVWNRYSTGPCWWIGSGRPPGCQSCTNSICRSLGWSSIAPGCWLQLCRYITHIIQQYLIIRCMIVHNLCSVFYHVRIRNFITKIIINTALLKCDPATPNLIWHQKGYLTEKWLFIKIMNIYFTFLWIWKRI